MKSKNPGLGDKVAAITKATGIEKIVKTFFGDDCGCDERRDRLNKMFSRPVKMMDSGQRKFFEEEIMARYKKSQNLTRHVGDAFYKLYEELLANEENTLATHHDKIMIAKVIEYDFELINEKVSEAIGSGTTFAWTTPLEVSVAEKITKMCNIDKVRITNTGTEATMHALRIA